MKRYKSIFKEKVIGLKKVIVTKNLHKDEVEEYWGETFDKVYAKVKGKDIDLYLQKYNETDMGLEFVKEMLIGNAKNNLTKDDYHEAYDKLF